jgi:hypothetical protein
MHLTNLHHQCDVSVGECFSCVFTANIARKKTYSQSTTHIPSPAPPASASNAANGNTSGDYPGNCIQTKEPTGWWEVDLGRSYTILNLTVWGRNDCMYMVV